MGHPHEEMVLLITCLDFSFTETTGIRYLSQDPGNLSPIPNPADTLDPHSPPDLENGSFSSLAKLWGGVRKKKKDKR